MQREQTKLQRHHTPALTSDIKQKYHLSDGYKITVALVALEDKNQKAVRLSNQTALLATIDKSERLKRQTPPQTKQRQTDSASGTKINAFFAYW